MKRKEVPENQGARSIPSTGKVGGKKMYRKGAFQVKFKTTLSTLYFTKNKK